MSTFSMTGDSLTLSGEEVELVFTALPPVPTAELTGTVWVLESLIEGSRVSSVNGDRGDAGAVHGRVDARVHRLPQPARDNTSFSGVEVAMTEMAAQGECPAELEAQDSHVVAVLGDGFSAVVDGQLLTLTSSGDLGLGYRSDS